MKYIRIIVAAAIVVGCVKEPPIIATEPSDGTANLNFLGRSFQYKNLQLLSPADTSTHRWAIDVSGILDNKDYFSLLIDSTNLQVLGRKTLINNNILGSLSDGDLIYGIYDLVENDAYEDYISLDSLSATKAYYSMQLNLLDSNLRTAYDTLWINGTMEVNLP